MPIVLSGSLELTGSVVATGNFTTAGNITAQTLVVQTITSSINYITGSSDFGSLQSNRHTFTGSLYITGSTSTFSGCINVGRNDDAYRLNVAVDTPKTCTTPRGLLSLTTCETFSCNPFGLVITATGGATIADRRVTIGTTDFGLANGGLMNINDAVYAYNSCTVGIGVIPKTSWTGTANKILQIGVRGAVGNSSTYGTLISYNAYYDGAWKYICSGGASSFMIGGGDFLWYANSTSGNDGCAIASFDVPKMVLSSTGYLGIGHSAPENALHVCINCASTGITIAQFENKDYTSGTRSYARVRAWANAGASYSSYFGQGQDGKTYIYANNTGRCGDIVIDANTGNVGVGTNVPTLQMHIHSNSGDYNTVFSTSCVCGRAGWVIARPGSTSAVASALVLASDCSFRLGNASSYNIKMMQDGSTSILNTAEGEAFKVSASGQTSIACNLEINNGYLSTSAGSGTSYSSRLFTNYNFPYIDTYLDSMAGVSYAARMTFRTNSGGGGMIDRLTITCSGHIYLGKGWGATNHRINLEVSEGNNIVVISGYSGASNDTAIFYASSGASGNGAATSMWMSRNSSTSRSINAGGTINASGSDYAEYMTKRCDTGCVAKGQIVGIDACKLLTDKWSLAKSFVVKSTDPSYVGGDVWDKNIGKRPQQTTDITDEEFAPILAEYEAKLEQARHTVDRVAFSGQVPVIVSGSYNVGDYVLPVEGPNDTIIGVACSLSSLTLEDYGKTVGRVWGTCLDKAWIAVKIG